MATRFPSDRHEQLNILSGKWDTSIQMLARDGQPTGVTGKAVDLYRWSANSHFLVHDVEAEIDGIAIQSLEIMAVDKNGDHFISRSYDADGSINDFGVEVNADQLRIPGRLQRFWGSFSDSHQTLKGRWQHRQNDMSEWLPLMDVVLSKRAK